MSDSPSLIAQLEHAALIGGFERTLLRDAAARIAELEAERDRLKAALEQCAAADFWKSKNESTLTAAAEELLRRAEIARAALSGEGQPIS